MQNKWGQEVTWISSEEANYEYFNSFASIIATFTLLPIAYIIAWTYHLLHPSATRLVQSLATRSKCYICNAPTRNYVYPGRGPYICNEDHLAKYLKNPKVIR